ncbi:arginase [Actinoplanes cyaneus]|uniref:Arginase n=1 Tax=Actinoplanes cyaneus TaxID=52696 RepID=A0A919IF48_9ACTN|nr:arginase family protein [Actinoplanes cyaneus]MCW2138130.1 arginase [Actinoplanes cyaneus]GID64659.1 arginase [Actinoplanes cyaneus]
MRKTTVLDAPSNLGLRPPAPGLVPGCYKLAGALRDQGLLGRLGARDGGVVVPPRYDVRDWKPGDGVLNADALAAYTRTLADRVDRVVGSGDFLLLLGGDCSILFGAALALRRRGRYGLAYLDGSIDFRHTGNSDNVGASAGETTAIVTGRGQPEIADVDGLAPYFREPDLVVLGVRDYDDELAEVRALGMPVWTTPDIVAEGPAVVGRRVVERLAGCDGFLVHLDADVLDPAVMPAADAPDPGGLDYPQLVALLRPLLADPACAGMLVTIYDPDLDPDGRHAAALTEAIVAAMGR